MLIVKLIIINLLFITGFILLLPESVWLFTGVTIFLILLAITQLTRAQREQQKILDTVTDGLLNLQDGDFSISLVELADVKKNNKQNQLIALFNQVADKLRFEKQTLYHRELLLDKVVNASDVITVLINHRDTIIFANRSAQHFFNQSSLLGQNWAALLQQHMPELLQHYKKHNAFIQLTTYSKNAVGEMSSSEQSWHLSQHQLKLHGSSNYLFLLKPITKELHQQELKTWKKVIRVINHELNNSIAPISTMCHSGKILADRLEEPQLNRVFNSIVGRIQKLSEFIQSYSQLARLSTPLKTQFNLVGVLLQLQSLYQFELINDSPNVMINADCSQIEQLLINLLKNAKQVSESVPSEIQLSGSDSELIIQIRDHGPGMTPEVMQKAFLPYYSTKAEGCGIGLSICRDIVDGHNGHIELSNHLEGGLLVTVQLPS